MEQNEIITVINQNGKKVSLEFIDSIKIDGHEYIIAGPRESEEAYAYKLVENKGEAEYLCLNYGEEFQRVLKEYNRH